MEEPDRRVAAPPASSEASDSPQPRRDDAVLHPGGGEDFNLKHSKRIRKIKEAGD